MEATGISRSIVECKGKLLLCPPLVAARISRSIVECKEICVYAVFLIVVGISRSIVECKGRRRNHSDKRLYV